MARHSLLRRLEEIADNLEPKAREAFLSAAYGIRADVVLADLAARIEAGDFEGAMRLLSPDPVLFQPFSEVVRQAVLLGGAASAAGASPLIDDRGARVTFRFDIRAPRIEEWLRSASSLLVTRIESDQREMIREALSAGLAEGRNPYAVASSIVGSYNRQRRRREGGIIGITAEQARYVRSARAELLSGDVQMMRQYLQRKRRDRTHDRTVTRAIREGRALTVAEADRLTKRYADRLLALRGETVARNEILSGINVSGSEAMEQAVDTGNVPRQFIRKKWRTARDERVRSSHRKLHGKVIGLDETYENGCRFPHDPEGPRSERIGCRCLVTHEIDYLAMAGLSPRAEEVEPA